jgi:hypothetical protein
MSRVTFHGRIEGGKLQIDREAFAAQLATLPDGEVTIKVQGQTRSERQNRWYWGVVLAALSDHTGYTAEELHELCKQRFNARTVSDVDPDTGEVSDSEWRQSTAALDSAAFTVYVERVRQWAAQEFGIVIPDPVTSGPGG